MKKFPTFYGTRKFIAAFTRARHLSPFWARPQQISCLCYISEEVCSVLTSCLCSAASAWIALSVASRAYEAPAVDEIVVLVWIFEHTSTLLLKMEVLWDGTWYRLANGRDRGASVFTVPGLLDSKVEYSAIFRNVCIYSAFFYRGPEQLLLWVFPADEYLRSGHTERGLPQRTAVSVRCGMLHSKQTLLTIIFWKHSS